MSTTTQATTQATTPAPAPAPKKTKAERILELQAAEEKKKKEQKTAKTEDTILITLNIFGIIIIIILFVVILYYISQREPEEDPCDDCPEVNCAAFGLPFFNSKYPYYANLQRCLQFGSNSDAVEFSIVNNTTANTFTFSPLFLSETDDCAPDCTPDCTDTVTDCVNFIVGSINPGTGQLPPGFILPGGCAGFVNAVQNFSFFPNYYMGWKSLPDGVTYYSSGIFMTLNPNISQFASLWQEMFLVILHPEGDDAELVPTPITFNNETKNYVQIKVDNPGRQRLSIAITGDSLPKLLVTINVTDK